MPLRGPIVLALGVLVAGVALPALAAAQIVEAVGTRALGMGGAFVAVADDSSATWWNPGALAAGPFFDMALARAVTEIDDQRPGMRMGVNGWTIATPPAGFSFYRWRLTELPTASAEPSREDEQGGIPLRSLAASQFGVTIVRSLMSGVHAGTTLKYVRGTYRTGLGSTALSPSGLLESGDDLEGGDTQHRFDLDLGILAVGGPLRVGALVRNLRETEFDSPDAALAPMTLPRQVRFGVAFDGDAVELAPFMVALDVDARRYVTATGDRRVVAIGGEHWLVRKRLAVRGGGRFNTVGATERVGTAGITVGVRSGLFVEGHLVRGGDAEEQGWGVSARVSF